MWKSCRLLGSAFLTLLAMASVLSYQLDIYFPFIEVQKQIIIEVSHLRNCNNCHFISNLSIVSKILESFRRFVLSCLAKSFMNNSSLISSSQNRTSLDRNHYRVFLMSPDFSLGLMSKKCYIHNSDKNKEK